MASIEATRTPFSSRPRVSDRRKMMLTRARVSSLENSISWAGTSKTSKLNVTKISGDERAHNIEHQHRPSCNPGRFETVARARGVKINDVASMHAKRNPAQNS